MAVDLWCNTIAMENPFPHALSLFKTSWPKLHLVVNPVLFPYWEGTDEVWKFFQEVLNRFDVLKWILHGIGVGP